MTTIDGYWGMTSHISAQSIAQILVKSLPRHWDGKACVEELKQADYHWRQMEWIGWWFEYRALNTLRQIGAQPGPEFGAVKFDCRLHGVWDFKAHTLADNDRTYAYLNDEQAVDACLCSGERFGWIVAVGRATYDTTGDFKRWHDELKGAESEYVKAGRAIGRRSRRRKSAFELIEVAWLEIGSVKGMEHAVESQILRRGLQAAQRNSDGSPRRAKYGFSYSRWKLYSGSAAAEVKSGVERVD